MEKGNKSINKSMVKTIFEGNILSNYSAWVKQYQ